ncbi:MAG TPA: septum formation initiator family protein [Vicinamibacteria bacterium]|nr:septum formation initiator family protein [Vicinamibacteria bacterium]
MLREERVGRDEKGRGAHGLRKKATTLFSVIAVIALMVGSLFGDRGILQLLRQRERTEALARDIERLREENRALAEEILALRRDPAAVERIAREQLGLARPGESVFVLRDAPSQRP